MAATLTTDRLLLRPLSAADLPDLVQLHSEASFWHYPLGRGQTAAETEQFLRRVLDNYASREFGLEAVVELRSGALAGWAGLSVPGFLPDILPAVEVGWRLGSPWRNQGYATEAAAAWVRWGFDNLAVDELVSIYEPANVASGRVMAKLGFEVGKPTIHASHGAEVHVTVLTRARWLQVAAGDQWPRTGR
jgi:RimJ/RimL family protein N-acetyltransferase